MLNIEEKIKGNRKALFESDLIVLSNTIYHPTPMWIQNLQVPESSFSEFCKLLEESRVVVLMFIQESP